MGFFAIGRLGALINECKVQSSRRAPTCRALLSLVLCLAVRDMFNMAVPHDSFCAAMLQSRLSKEKQCMHSVNAPPGSLQAHL